MADRGRQRIEVGEDLFEPPWGTMYRDARDGVRFLANVAVNTSRPRAPSQGVARPGANAPAVTPSICRSSGTAFPASRAAASRPMAGAVWMP